MIYIFVLLSILVISESIFYSYKGYYCNKLIKLMHLSYELYYLEVYNNKAHRIGTFSNEGPYNDCFKPNNKYLLDSSPRELNNYQILRNRIESYTNLNISKEQLEAIWIQVNNSTSKDRIIGTFVLHCTHITTTNKKTILIFSDPFNSIKVESKLSARKLKKYKNRLVVVDLIFNKNKEIHLKNITETIYTYTGILNIKNLKKIIC